MKRPAGVTRLAALLREQDSRATSVARLLHDETAPALVAIGFSLRALKGDPVLTEEVRTQLERAMETVRTASRQLHTNVVERSGLPLALEMLAEQVRRRGPAAIDVQLETSGRCPEQIGFPIYKIVELAAENIIKHSKASTARIAVQVAAGETRVEVSDNGCGFIVERVRRGLPGTGLVLMELYAKEIGFDLDIDSYPNRGTIVRTQTK